jgi:hypothetical protein
LKACFEPAVDAAEITKKEKLASVGIFVGVS